MDTVLAMLLAMLPRRDPESLRPWADAIAESTDDAVERATLAAVAVRETGCRQGPRIVPFGVLCCRRPGMTLRDFAATALRILRRGRTRCGSREGALGFFHTGRCVVDEYSRATVRDAVRIRRAAAAARDGRTR